MFFDLLAQDVSRKSSKLLCFFYLFEKEKIRPFLHNVFLNNSQLKKFSQSNGVSVPGAQKGPENEEPESSPIPETPAATTTRRPPYPSPPPAPQRVPHPPNRPAGAPTNRGIGGGGFSPFPNRRKGGRLFGTLPSTPTPTPFSTPFLKRRQFGGKDGSSGSGGSVDSHPAKFNSFLAQHNQIYSLDDDPLLFIPTKCRRPRRRLVLHNKAPMWNEASQVYQLDFGGRVTQESAKNFQIEYKGKQARTFFF